MLHNSVKENVLHYYYFVIILAKVLVTVKDIAPPGASIENIAQITASTYPNTPFTPTFFGKSNLVLIQVKDPVPEPSTLIFFGTGLFGLLVLGRRKLKKRK